MFKICELWTVILWYELNPRVRCAFGNVWILAFTIDVWWDVIVQTQHKTDQTI